MLLTDTTHASLLLPACSMEALPEALLGCSRLETLDLSGAVERLEAQPLRQLLAANPYMRCVQVFAHRQRREQSSACSGLLGSGLLARLHSLVAGGTENWCSQCMYAAPLLTAHPWLHLTACRELRISSSALPTSQLAKLQTAFPRVRPGCTLLCCAVKEPVDVPFALWHLPFGSAWSLCLHCMHGHGVWGAGLTQLLCHPSFPVSRSSCRRCGWSRLTPQPAGREASWVTTAAARRC